MFSPAWRTSSFPRAPSNAPSLPSATELPDGTDASVDTVTVVASVGTVTVVIPDVCCLSAHPRRAPGPSTPYYFLGEASALPSVGKSGGRADCRARCPLALRAAGRSRPSRPAH